MLDAHACERLFQSDPKIEHVLFPEIAYHRQPECFCVVDFSRVDGESSRVQTIVQNIEIKIGVRGFANGEENL